MRPKYNPNDRIRIRLGVRFIDHLGRIFQVYETFLGPMDAIKWTMELIDDTKIHGSDRNGDVQTAIGFYQMDKEHNTPTGDLIIRKIGYIEKHLDNGNLRII
jgi:hypothetical protein